MEKRENDDPSQPDPLVENYRAQIGASMDKEAAKRIKESHDPSEISRLQNFSLIDLWSKNDPDLIPALMARLGPVRAALDGHGGGLVVKQAIIEDLMNGRQAISLVLDLDGACVSCGAAPGTLKGIQDDLLIDPEVISVQFSSEMLDWFDDLQRDFVLEHGGVTFV